MADGNGDRVVARDERTDEEVAAIRWAVSAGHELGLPAVGRMRQGGGGITRRELDAIAADWEAAGRPAPEPHLHRTTVVVEDGAAVMGVTFVDDDPYRRETPPSFGLYLDERWQPPWPHANVDWPDFGLPTNPEAFTAALRDALRRAQSGEVVEVGCWGGHGRTGTALACLAVLAGTPRADAVAWIRANYCPLAVETPDQEALVAAFQP